MSVMRVVVLVLYADHAEESNWAWQNLMAEPSWLDLQSDEKPSAEQLKSWHSAVEVLAELTSKFEYGIEKETEVILNKKASELVPAWRAQFPRFKENLTFGVNMMIAAGLSTEYLRVSTEQVACQSSGGMGLILALGS